MLQQLLLQKQTFQAQLMETAQEEIKKSGVIYKFAGNVLVLSKKEDIERDLMEKNETIMLRIKNIEKQEELSKEKIKKLRGEILEEIKKNQGKK